ncbi:MAG TPA: hypothetical protein VHK24_14650 [Steroidobacter sp.]|nr:hypothetical protein [Steroidobacter sp.]
MAFDQVNIRARRVLVLTCAAIAVLASAACTATRAERASYSAWLGSWRLAPEQSQLANATPPGLTLTVLVATPDELQFELHWNSPPQSENAAAHETYSGRTDGQPYPVRIGEQIIAEASYRWATPQALEGSAVSVSGMREEYRIELAPDRRSFVQNRRVQTKLGRTFEERMVFVRADALR